MFRYQLPVHSPVDALGLLAGVMAPAMGTRVLERVRSRLLVRYSASDGLLTDSGTSALVLAIAGAVPPGECVALPAYGCYDLATAAIGADRRVLLYDVDPHTLGPDARSLDAAVAQGVAAVVVAPLYGMPVATDAVQVACARAGAIVIEDAAQGAGAALRGRPVGSWGSVSVLSFGRGKGMTGGGGGALLTRDADGERILRTVREACRPARSGWRAVASCAALWFLGRPNLYRLPASVPFLRLGDTVYRDPWPPRAMPRTVAGILARALARPDETEERQAKADRLLRAVRRAGDLRAVSPVDGAVPGYLRLPAIRSGPRARSIGAARALGVAAGYPRPLAELPQLEGRVANADAAFAGAHRLAERLITLPTHGLLAEPDLARLERWILGTTADRGSRPADRSSEAAETRTSTASPAHDR